MTRSAQVRDHPALLRIVAALLNGRPCSEISQELGLEPAALRAYAIEAGLGRGPDPEPQPRPPDAPCSEPIEREEADAADTVDRPAEHERQVLTEASRRRGEPEGQRPQPDQGTYLEDSRTAMRQELERIDMERRAYEEQPRPHLTLCSDPEFRVGWQPESRLRALITREQLDKAERVRQWFAADLFRWRQPPPYDL